MKRFTFSIIVAIGLIAAANADAWVQSTTLLAKAEPDECFAGIGEPYPDPASIDPFTCPEGSQEKTNQSYIWGLTKAGDSLWAGTGANILCTTQGVFITDYNPDETHDYVCEYNMSQIALEHPNFPPRMGDWRPPKIYEYDLSTGALIDRTPNDPSIYRNIGIRSAGSHNGVVFMAGGSLDGGVTMFAYDAVTKAYLGSKTFTDYRTIRKWTVVNGILYTGMGTKNALIGHVMRWFGNRDDLWNFQPVGVVFGLPRELTEYVGADGLKRIAVNANSVWVSPSFISGAAGLLPRQAQSWKEVWHPSYYEPDPVTRNTYVGGGIHNFDGWVYFGTMHIPMNAMDNHQQCTTSDCFGVPRNSYESYLLYNGTWRATSIWRARNLESDTPEIQLLYGEAKLPKYNASKRRFDTVTNVNGYQPVYGKSGFGNTYNNYAWVMEAVDGRLFVGTMDCSSLFLVWETSYRFGADLWRFDSADSPAVSESLNGLGNSLNYGIRCLIASEDETKLFAGTANPMNLTSEGGWELLQLE